VLGVVVQWIRNQILSAGLNLVLELVSLRSSADTSFLPLIFLKVHKVTLIREIGLLARMLQRGCIVTCQFSGRAVGVHSQLQLISRQYHPALRGASISREEHFNKSKQACCFN
jgi:hypothetical protein